MEILLARNKYYPTHTIGQVYIDGDYFCFSLEDVVRDGPKVHGETAIPTGTYSVTLENSPRFGPDTITINRVPGFSYIRIHSGNSDKDTEGCPILGYKLSPQNIIQYGSTKPAVADMKLKIKKALQEGQKVNITVTNIGRQ